MRSNHENPSTPSSLVNAALAALSPALGIPFRLPRARRRQAGEGSATGCRRSSRPRGWVVLRLARARDAKGAR